MELKKRVELKKADRTELYCLEPPFPRANFLIETSNACNHKCIFCAHTKMTRKIGKIKPELAHDILRQAYELGTREVGFYATGEPFLVPELPEYIKKAKEIGYEYVYLTSNGALATAERIRAVIGAGLDSIKFSINATDRRTYEFIHGKDDFYAVMDNLKHLNDYRKECGRAFRIFVTGILTRYTEHMKDSYHEVFGGLADEIVFKNVYNQGGYMPEIESLLKCYTDDETFRRCNLPFDAISVTYEGYLSIENADYENMLVVADLNKVSLKDGWYGEKMKEVRQKFLDGDLSGLVCDGCVYHDVRPGRPTSPDLAASPELNLKESDVKRRIDEFGPPPLVYVPMAADIIHPGHINLLKEAAKYGSVMVGLFTDEAIESYKKPPSMDYGQRKTVVESLKHVKYVVSQKTKDFGANLAKFRPAYMVHGTDWKTGPLAESRQKAIDLMASWGGTVIEPEYTQGVSSSAIKEILRAHGKE